MHFLRSTSLLYLGGGSEQLDRSFLLISRTECRCKLCRHIWKHVPAPVRKLRTASELDGASFTISQLWFKLKYFSWITSKSCRLIISINFSSFSGHQGEACFNVKSGLLRVHTLLNILLQTNREWSNEILQANKTLTDNHFLAYTTSFSFISNLASTNLNVSHLSVQQPAELCQPLWAGVG